MGIGLSAFLVFGLLYLLVPSLVGDEADVRLGGSAALSGLVPFAFALLLAGSSAYAMRWPLLFGYVALLDAALVAIALRRSGRVGLLLAASAATALMLPMWAGSGLGRSALWGPSLAAIGLTVLLNLPPRLARRLRLNEDDGLGPALESVGLVASAGLLLFAFVLVVRGFGEPPWTFLVVLIALLALLFERTGERRLPQVLVAGALALSVLVQLWFFRADASATALVRDLSLPLLLAAALSLVASLPRPGSGGRGRRRSRCRGGGARRDRGPVRVSRQRRARGRRLAALRRAGRGRSPAGGVGARAAGPVSCPWPSRPRRSSPRAGTRRTSSARTCPWPRPPTLSSRSASSSCPSWCPGREPRSGTSARRRGWPRRSPLRRSFR